jgi:hypothetical protein
MPLQLHSLFQSVVLPCSCTPVTSLCSVFCTSCLATYVFALQLQAAAALGMLATDSSNRRAIAVAGCVPSLVQLLSSKNEETQVTLAVSCCC